MSAADLDRLDASPHVVRLVRAAWELGGLPELEELHLRKWAHCLGFVGHFSTKSRRYWTTFTALAGPCATTSVGAMSAKLL